MIPPVLFIIFNPPDTTQRVFDAIRQAQPSQLFVAADGARPTKNGELILCQQTRDIIKQVDWQCKVKTLLREQNLGCGRAVSQAIAWFFDNVEKGIILEDDTLPHASFFLYCAELLEKYRNDTRIMQISGYNYLQKWLTEYDYFYTMTAGANWAWATWRRAWLLYDYDMRLWAMDAAKQAVRNISPTKFSWKKRNSLYSKILERGGGGGMLLVRGIFSGHSAAI